MLYAPKPRLLASILVLMISQTALSETIDPLYEKAIRDTAVMKASNERTLTPLNKQVERFVVWTDYNGYQPNDHYTMPLNLFVARESEMKAACSQLALVRPSPSPFGSLKGRINQLLGLPRYDADQRFVQIVMNVEQPNNGVMANYSASTVGQALFRPCGNPDVHSNQCGLDFASDVNDEFKMWIYQKTRQSYHESAVNPATNKIRYGYPWTDLGYTYNWNIFTPNHVGVEEFVVKKGAEVKVVRQDDGTAYRTAAEFCKS